MKGRVRVLSLRQLRDPRGDGDGSHVVDSQELDRLADALRELTGRLTRLVRQNHEKFFAAPADRDISAPEKRGKVTSHFPKNPISGRVSVSVVDHFEMVDVEKHEGQRTSRPPGP